MKSYGGVAVGIEVLTSTLVSGVQLHAPIALSSGKESAVPITQEEKNRSGRL
jgi:hypothetical protein